jgi:PAS domain S-box-containing protein
MRRTINQNGIDAESKQHRQVLQDLLDSSSNAMFSLDRAYCYTAFNRVHASMMEKINGVRIKLGGSILAYLTHPQGREQTRLNMDRAYQGEQFTSLVVFDAEADDRSHFEFRYIPVHAEDGTVVGVNVVSENITELKKAESSLQSSQELFHTSFMHASVGIVMVSATGEFLNVNPAFCEMLGYSQAELCGMSFSAVTFEQDKPLGLTLIADALAGRAQTIHFEKRYVRKNRAIVWVDVSSTAIRNAAGEFQYLITYVQDITRAKKAQEELLAQQVRLKDLVHEQAQQLVASEAQYRNLFDSISSIIVVFDPDDGRILDANPAACAFFGCAYDELLNSRMPDLVAIPEEEKPTHAEKIRAGTKVHMQATYRRSSGEIRSLSVYPGMLQHKQGFSVLAVLHDITEANQALQAQRQLEYRFNILFNNLPMSGVIFRFEYDAAGDICDLLVEDINDIALIALRQTREQIIGKSFRPLFEEKTVDRYLRVSNELKATGQFITFDTYFELHQRYVITTVYLISPDLCVAISVDDTDRRRSEQLLKDSENTLRRIIDTIPNLIWSSRPDGYIDYLNNGDCSGR